MRKADIAVKAGGAVGSLVRRTLGMESLAVGAGVSGTEPETREDIGCGTGLERVVDGVTVGVGVGVIVGVGESIAVGS
jgi:hypothetical protein